MLITGRWIVCYFAYGREPLICDRPPLALCAAQACAAGSSSRTSFDPPVSFQSQTPRRRATRSGNDEKGLLRLNLQSRVVELERACKEMKGQMSRMAKGKSLSSLSFGAASCHQTGGKGLQQLLP